MIKMMADKSIRTGTDTNGKALMLDSSRVWHDISDGSGVSGT